MDLKGNEINSSQSKELYGKAYAGKPVNVYWNKMATYHEL